MEIRDDWSPEAKFEPSVATLPTKITLNRVKSILTSSVRRHNSIQDIPTRSWPHNGTNCSLLAITGSGKATVETKTAIPEGSVQRIMKGYWTSNSFQWVLILCVWKPGFMKFGHI